MDDHETAIKTIHLEITGDIAEVKASYLNHFGPELKQFVEVTAQAFCDWKDMKDRLDLTNKHTIISCMTLSAISLHIISMRLFLTGFIVAAGNTQRQVIETIALVLLCSCKSLPTLSQFMEDKYSSQNSVRDLRRNAALLKVDKRAITAIQEARDFYHVYSHPTRATLASFVPISGGGNSIYVGAAFDEDKLDQYQLEMSGRVNLAKLFPNIIGGVKANLDCW